MSNNLDLSSNTLKIIPLGGLHEIGKNTMAIAYGKDMILVDAGLAFPSDDMPGVDLVLPDISFLLENKDKLRGLAITHGHEDHIGGIPFLLKQVHVPAIYGPALSLSLLDGKLKEFGLENETQMHKVHPRQEVQMGCFTVKFIRCTHSIADSFSLIIKTPIGTIVHTGDFKFDLTPVDGERFDIYSLTAAAKDGILLLMSDSTNVEREGYTPSERTVWKKLDEVFAASTGRIIVTTFASNVHRIRQILQAAMKYDRKVTVLGRSMLNLAGIARELGYMSFPDGLLVPVEAISGLPHNKLVVLTTGSQGEPMSALSRVAKNEHKQIKIVPGDTVIISATPIPGNERLVSNTVNQLFMRGANVIYGRESGVHVSGHACREEQKLMINLCRPKFFMPVHGEYRMLVKHAELAVECGMQAEDTFVMANGDILEISSDGTQEKAVHHPAAVKSGIVLVDASRTWEVDEKILNDRRAIAEAGVMSVMLTIDSQYRVLAGPDINAKGLIVPGGLETDEFLDKIGKSVLDFIKEWIKNDLQSGIEGLKDHLLTALHGYFHKLARPTPFLQVLIQEIGVKNSS
jgi:ribonuclease J